MKKITLILMSVLLLLSSCAADEITGSSYIPPVISSEVAKELSKEYDDLVFDNETPLKKMKLSKPKNLGFRKAFYPLQGYSLSSFLSFDELKNNIEHLYLRQNGDEVYAAGKIEYEGNQYYVIVPIDFQKVNEYAIFECIDGALIHNKLVNPSIFNKIKIGVTTFEDIMKMDKTALIHKGTFASDHRLKDGRILVVWYENSAVERKYIEEDRHNFLDKLLPIDREAIT